MDLKEQSGILENCKKIIEVSQSRGYWKLEEINNKSI